MLLSRNPGLGWFCKRVFVILNFLQTTFYSLSDSRVSIVAWFSAKDSGKSEILNIAGIECVNSFCEASAGSNNV